MKLSDYAKESLIGSFFITVATFAYLYIIKEIFYMRFGEVANKDFIWVCILYYSYLWLTTLIDIIWAWLDTHYD